MNETYYRRASCRLCGGLDLDLVVPLKPSALCDAYIKRENLAVEQEVYPLELVKCADCGYVFLPVVVDPEVIYRDYIYVSTSSMGLSDHFSGYAESVLAKLNIPKMSLAVDIGSNDGTLLRYFKGAGMKVLGIEPATKIARQASDDGIPTLPEFFDPSLALKIGSEYGPATLITVNNLFANIDDLESFMTGVSSLLDDDGCFIVESSYLADMVNHMVFDFIYHEHLSYFSVKPLQKFFRRFGLELFDIQRVQTKGGSLRYYVQKADVKRAASPAIEEFLAYEESIGLYGIDYYKSFVGRITTAKDKLTTLLTELKNNGKTVAAFGGSATSTTLLYHFEIAGMLAFIVDDNPAKHNTFSPGHHIPVLPSTELYARSPDYTVVLAWRYFDPIVKNNRVYLDRGGRFIRPLPELMMV